MWKAINKSEVPIKIFQFGKPVIVPFDRQIRIFEDDSVFEDCKSMFHVIQEPPKVKFVDKTETIERPPVPEVKSRPLENVRIKLTEEQRKEFGSKYRLAQNMANVNKSTSRKRGRKSDYNWTFISPMGDVYAEAKLSEMRKLLGFPYVNNIYKYANKTYNGWKIIREDKPKEE